MNHLMTRAPYDRMKVIWAFIRAGYYPNCSDLARILETSTKSIHRDIDFMRDRFEMPIQYNGSRFGYELTGKPVCCFCCATASITQRFDLERKPEPVTGPPIVAPNWHRRKKIFFHQRELLSGARKIAKARYEKKRYHSKKHANQ